MVTASPLQTNPVRSATILTIGEAFTVIPTEVNGLQAVSAVPSSNNAITKYLPAELGNVTFDKLASLRLLLKLTFETVPNHLKSGL